MGRIAVSNQEHRPSPLSSRTSWALSTARNALLSELRPVMVNGPGMGTRRGFLLIGDRHRQQQRVGAMTSHSRPSIQHRDRGTS